MMWKGEKNYLSDRVNIIARNRIFGAFQRVMTSNKKTIVIKDIEKNSKLQTIKRLERKLQHNP